MTYGELFSNLFWCVFVRDENFCLQVFPEIQLIPKIKNPASQQDFLCQTFVEVILFQLRKPIRL